MLRNRFKRMLIRVEEFLLKPRPRGDLRKVVYIFFAATLFITTYFLAAPYIGNNIEYKIGDIAIEDIRINRDIRYELPKETEKVRSEAFEKGRYVFDRDYQALRNITNELNAEFKRFLSTIKETNDPELIMLRFPSLRNLKSVSPEDLTIAAEKERYRNSMVSWAAGFATLVFDNYGLLDKPFEEMENLEKVGASIRTIGGSESTNEFSWNSSRIIYHRDIFNFVNYALITELAERDFQAPISEEAKKIAITRVMQVLYKNPYLTYNAVETEKRKTEAAEEIKPVYSVLKKGLTIVRAGDPVDNDILTKIQILNRHQGKTNFIQIIGVFLIQLILILATSFYIYRYSEFSMRDLASYIILISLLYIIIFYSFFMSRYGAVMDSPIYFGLYIPMIFISTMTCLLLGARVTFASGTFITFYLYFLSGHDTATLVLSFISVITGIYATLRMKKRNHFFKVALFGSFALTMIVIGIDLDTNMFGNGTGARIGMAVGNAFFSIILTTGILPIYESFFNLPTNFRLMELADFNHPLLKKLSIEAPSSYAHSLLMSSLSERAVGAINGDTLLTRVGCLYHDIGKMNNAAIYAENKHLKEGAEKNEGTSPADYARTIIRHVTDGIEMAREHRLPEKIISFIPEHHGTTVMQYFYHQALQQNNNSQVVKEAFQYPGPKPKSKETAVVMIADSVEAASRSLSNPTKENLSELVESIVEGKISEGQLNESPLTMNDLRIIKESFLEALISTYHLRPKYPTQSQTRRLEKSQEKSQEKSKEAMKEAKKSAKKAAPKKAPPKKGTQKGPKAKAANTKSDKTTNRPTKKKPTVSQKPGKGSGKIAAKGKKSG